MTKLDLILLIDDNDADNEFHQLVIDRAEITRTLKTLSNSIKALEYFRACFSLEDNPAYPLPDLIFLDINMPALNGFELLDKIRLLPDIYNKKAKMKIFMLTGSLNPDDFKRASTEYADIITGFRIKPLSDTIFLEIIRSHFSPI